MSNNNFYCIFFVTLFSPLLSFGQGKIAQITYQSYDVDSAVWITNHQENWEYDNTDREVVHTTWDIYQGPFAPYNNTRLESTYHSNGQLVFQKNRSWGDTIWIETETTYEYDASDNLKKIFLIVTECCDTKKPLKILNFKVRIQKEEIQWHLKLRKIGQLFYQLRKKITKHS